MELKRKEREEEKARLKEEKKRLRELRQSSSQEDIKSQPATTGIVFCQNQISINISCYY